MDTFREHCHNELASIYLDWARSVHFLQTPQSVEKLYATVKKVNQGSAIHNWTDVYSVSRSLLDGFHFNGTAPSWTLDSLSMEKGLKQLLRILRGVTPEDIEEAPKGSIIGVEARVSVLTEDVGLFQWIEECLARDFSCTAIAPNDSTRSWAKDKPAIVILDLRSAASEDLITSSLHDLRHNPWMMTLPVVGIVEQHSQEKRWSRLGVDAFIRTPLDSESLLWTLLRLDHQRNRFQQSLMKGPLHTLDPQHHEADMKKLIEKEWARFIRNTGVSFSLIYVKLDSWMNHLHGEETADLHATLREYYTLLSKKLRYYDELRRWSMDSFMILLPFTPLTGAEVVAQRLIDSISGHEAPTSCVPFSISTLAIESQIRYETADKMVEHLLKQREQLNLPRHHISVDPFTDHTLRVDERNETKVLLLDDDLATQVLIQNYFTTEEWSVRSLQEDEDLMDLLYTWRPQVIISEMRSAYADGFQLCLQLKQTPEFKDTCFIFLSKFALERDIVRGFQVGADEFMTKPFAMLELEARIRRRLTKVQP